MPRKALLRFLILPLLLVGAFAAVRFTALHDYLTVAAVTALFDRLRQVWWAPVALIGSYIVLLPFGLPATPLMIAGSAVFGSVLGSVYNLIGTLLGGALTFYLGRYLGRDFAAHFGGKRLKKLERTLARRGFWSLVGIRFLPLPYTVLNYTAALAGVRPALFLTTTAIGLTPTIALYTVLYATITRAATGGVKPGLALYLEVAGALLLLILATAIPQVLERRKRRERYREIRQRRARPAPRPPAGA